jgi:hypothetical protein
MHKDSILNLVLLVFIVCGLGAIASIEPVDECPQYEHVVC